MSLPKKRRCLILASSDSEMEDYYVSPRSKTVGTTPEERDAVVKEIKEEKRSDINIDCDNQAKYLGSESVKRRNWEIIDGEKDSKSVKMESVSLKRNGEASILKNGSMIDRSIERKENLGLAKTKSQKGNCTGVKIQGKSDALLIYQSNKRNENKSNLNGEKTRVIEGSSSAVKLPKNEPSIKHLNSEKIRDKKHNREKEKEPITKVRDQIEKMLFDSENQKSHSHNNKSTSNNKFNQLNQDMHNNNNNKRKKLHRDYEYDSDDYIPYEYKRTVLSWLIDLNIISKNNTVSYINPSTNKIKLRGKIKREGILCNCCNKILTISKFETHAGYKNSQNQPYENIFIEELRVSLLKCLLKAWEKQGVKGTNEIVPNGDDPSDDTCGICGDGGDLIICDTCPSTFHLACLGFKKLPPGDWHCMNCICKFCTKNTQKYSSASKLLSCLQCGKKYHEDCVSEKEIVNNSFCDQSCRKIHKQLQQLLGVKNEIEDGYSWRLVRRLKLNNEASQQRLNKVLNCNSKLVVAFNVMNECFLPILDRKTGIDLIHSVVYNYGSNFNRLNFDGFYTFILERGDEIISAASVRIHGEKLAEMPFIGTRNMYRRQGMCKVLLSGIESALASLNVKKLVIPAIKELKSTWINIFGFNQLDPSQKKQFRNLNLLMFPDTGLLQKPIASDQKLDKRVGGNLGHAAKITNLPSSK